MEDIVCKVRTAHDSVGLEAELSSNQNGSSRLYDQIFNRQSRREITEHSKDNLIILHFLLGHSHVMEILFES